MAFPVEPDNELTYVPTVEDETAGNLETPADPFVDPDTQSYANEPDNAEQVVAPVENTPSESDNTERVGYSPDNELGAEPAFASIFGVPLEADGADADQDTGDLYAATTLAPNDSEYSAAPGVTPPVPEIEGLDFWEAQKTEDFETDDYGFDVADDATGVPVSYEIQGRQPGGAWRTLATVSATDVTTEVHGLPAGEGWTFRIRAVFVTGETGAWSAETDIQLPSDLLAPPTPTAPTVRAERGIITVAWDGLGANASEQPADYKHTVVWVSETGDPSTFTPIGLLFGAGEFMWTNAAYNVGYFFALSSLDLSGNTSGRSTATPATLKPLVEEPDIQAELDRIDAETGGLITEAGELNDRLVQAETDLVAHDGVIKDLNEVKLPALQGELDANEATVDTLKNTTIPALNTRLGTAETELSTTKTELNGRLATAEGGLTEAQGLIDQLEDDVVLAARTAAIEDLYVTGVGTIKTAVIDKLWADVIRARKIMADQLIVGSGSNLIVDPGFADVDLTARRAQLSSGDWYKLAAFMRTPTATNSGTKTLLMLSAPSDSSTTTPIPLVSGATYRIRYEAFKSSASMAGNTRTAWRLTDTAGVVTFVSDGSTNDQPVGGAPMYSSWSTYERMFTVPANVVSGGMQIQILATSGDGYYAIRNVSVAPAVDGSLVVNGTIMGNHLEVNSVSTAVANVIKLNASAINAGTINTARLNATEIAAATAAFQKVDVSNLTSSTATISQAVIEKLWADVIHAKKITADMLVIGAGNNLIPNARLTSSDGWDGWGRNASNGPDSQPSIWGLGTKNLFSSSFELTPGKDYRFEVQAMAQYSGSRIYIQLVTTGSTANPYLVQNAALSTSWQTFTSEFVAPGGVTSARLQVYVNHANGTSTNGYQWFTGWGLFPMASGELIVDGAITATKIDTKAVTAGKIATNAITADKIDAGAITATKIDTKAVTADKIATSAVIAEKIATNAITADKIDAKAVTAAKIATGAITADKIDGGAIDGKVITGATVRTSASSSRFELAGTSVRAYKDGTEFFTINPDSGTVWMNGSFQSSSLGGVLGMTPYFINVGTDGVETPSITMGENGGSTAAAIMPTAIGSHYMATALIDNKLKQTYGFTMNSKPHATSTVGQFALWYFDQYDQLPNSYHINQWYALSLSPYGTHSSPPVLRLYESYNPDTGQFPSFTGGTGLVVDITQGSHRVGISSSLSKFKLNQREIPEELDDKILSLQAKTWFDKEQAEAMSEAMRPRTADEVIEMMTPNREGDREDRPFKLRRIPGVIAEDVQAAGLDDFLAYGTEKVTGVQYDRLGVALIPVVRRQRDRIASLEDKVNGLEAKLEALLARVETLETSNA